jgi:hypothetical protein
MLAGRFTALPTCRLWGTLLSAAASGRVEPKHDPLPTRNGVDRDIVSAHVAGAHFDTGAALAEADMPESATDGFPGAIVSE